MTTQKAILLLRSHNPDDLSTLNQVRSSLLTAAANEGFEIIEIFYYQVGDGLRSKSIKNFIECHKDEILIVTNDLPFIDSKVSPNLSSPLINSRLHIVEVYRIDKLGRLYKSNSVF